MFTPHLDLLDREEREADNDFSKHKQIPVTHTHTHTLFQNVLAHLAQSSSDCCSGAGGRGYLELARRLQNPLKLLHHHLCTRSHSLSHLHTSLQYWRPNPHLEKSRLAPRKEACNSCKWYRLFPFCPWDGPIRSSPEMCWLWCYLGLWCSITFLCVLRC